MIVAIFVFVNPRNIASKDKVLRMGFNHMKLKFQEYSICVPPRAFASLFQE